MTEEQKARICDEICHYKKTYMFQSDIDEKCEKCVLNEVDNEKRTCDLKEGEII